MHRAQSVQVRSYMVENSISSDRNSDSLSKALSSFRSTTLRRVDEESMNSRVRFQSIKEYREHGRPLPKPVTVKWKDDEHIHAQLASEHHDLHITSVEEDCSERSIAEDPLNNYIHALEDSFDPNEVAVRDSTIENLRSISQHISNKMPIPTFLLSRKEREIVPAVTPTASATGENHNVYISDDESDCEANLSIKTKSQNFSEV